MVCVILLLCSFEGTNVYVYIIHIYCNIHSFAAAELHGIHQQTGQSASSSSAAAESTASAMFRMASQDTELTYTRSLQILERYSGYRGWEEEEEEEEGHGADLHPQSTDTGAVQRL